MHWFPFYSSDFIGATVGLSCLERSLYALMIPLYYEVGPFPSDPVRVYRIVGCESDEQKRAVDFLLGHFFVLKDDGWYQPRAEKEKVLAAQISDRARNKARKRWDAAKHDAAALLEHSRSSARAMPATATATATATSTTKEKDTHASAWESKEPSTSDLAVEEGTAEKGYKPPNCPHQELERMYSEICTAMPRMVDYTDRRKYYAAARWKQVCVADKLDADACKSVFRDFFSRAASSKFLSGGCQPRDKNRKPFVASFDWLMRPENFLKVFEGKYDD